MAAAFRSAARTARTARVRASSAIGGRCLSSSSLSPEQMDAAIAEMNKEMEDLFGSGSGSSSATVDFHMPQSQPQATPRLPPQQPQTAPARLPQEHDMDAKAALLRQI